MVNNSNTNNLFSLISYVNMLIILAFVLVISALFFVEQKASYCGKSWFEPEMPKDLSPRWFNGLFLIEDKEGFVISPFYRIKKNQGDVVIKDVVWGYPEPHSIGIYVRIRRYLLDHGLFLEYEQWDQQTSTFFDSGDYYYLIINNSDNSIYPRFYSKTKFEAVSKKSFLDKEWISVVGASCWYGVWFVPIRIVLLTCLLLLTAIIYKRSRKTGSRNNWGQK